MGDVNSDTTQPLRFPVDDHASMHRPATVCVQLRVTYVEQTCESFTICFCFLICVYQLFLFPNICFYSRLLIACESVLCNYVLT